MLHKEQKMAKDHVGNFDHMNWDKNQLLAEVEGYEEGHKITTGHIWQLDIMLPIKMVS